MAIAWQTPILALLSCGFATSAPGQVLDRGEISGIVRDQSGALLPGVSLQIRENSMGFERVVVSNAAGQFVVVLLPPGDYRIRAELEGFEPVEHHVRLAVGQRLTLTLEMPVAGLTQAVDVRAAAAAGGGVTTAVGNDAIGNLPINGRDYRDFALLAPTAQAITGTRGTFRLGGHAGDYLALLVDGADFTNGLFGEFFGSIETKNFTIPLEAVQEFRVVAGSFGAEHGRSNGGLVNVVTRSGTNTTRGAVAYYLRHHRLTAVDAFGNPPDGLVRHQFGGSLGGPIAQNRTFYFVAAEAQKQQTPITVRFARDVRGVAVPELGIADLGALQGQFPRYENVVTVLGKLDHALTPDHRFSSRLNATRNESRNVGAGGSLILARATSNLETVTNSGLSSVSSLFSSLGTRLFSEVKLQVSGEVRPRQAQGEGPQVQIADTGNFGGSSVLPATQDMYRYQVSKNINALLGRHTLKAGGDYNGFNVRNNSFALSRDGAYAFPTLESFLERRPSVYSQFFGLGGHTADQAALLKSLWQHEIAFYVHDQFRPGARLTLGLGLRYDAQFNPSPVFRTAGRRVPIGAPRPTPTGIEVDFAPVPQDIPDDINNFAPRFDLTYDLRGNGATIVTTAAGYHVGRTPMIYFPLRGSGVAGTTIMAPPEAFGVTFPNVLPGTIQPGSTLEGLVPKPSIQYVDPGFQNPRVLNVSGSVSQRLWLGWTVELGALLSDSRHLRIGGFRSTFWDRNLHPPTTFDQFGRGVVSTAVRPDPTIGAANAMGSFGRGRYQAFVLQANRLLDPRWQLYVSYTLARNRSNASTERDTEATFGPSDPFDLEADYGANEMDVRHTFTAYAVGRLPWRLVVGASGTASSGLAFPAYSPADANGDGVRNNGLHPDRPAVDGRLLPRFPFHQPSAVTWNLRVSRDVRLRSRGIGHVIVEVFNLLNTANRFSDPRTNATFGQPNFRELNRTLGPRIGQVGWRIDF